MGGAQFYVCGGVGLCAAPAHAASIFRRRSRRNFVADNLLDRFAIIRSAARGAVETDIDREADAG